MRNLWFIQRFFIALMASFTVIGIGALIVYTAQHSLIGVVAEIVVILSAVATLEGGKRGRSK